MVAAGNLIMGSAHYGECGSIRQLHLYMTSFGDERYQRLMKTCNLSNSITDVDYLVHYIVKEFEFVAYYYGKGMAQFC